MALVIATHFGAREIRLKTSLSGSPLGHFSHSQGFDSGEDVAQMLKYVIEHHSKIDPGVLTDIIIANSDVGFPGASQCLIELESKPLTMGVVRTFTRPNVGLSFGAYADAFDRYKEDYDYFLFTEDDVLIGRHHFAKIGIDRFNSLPDCGFLAYVGVSVNHHVVGSHAAGGIGLTSTDVLLAVTRHYGRLSHYQSESNRDRWFHILHGEIAFTNDIEKLGYTINEIPPKMKLYDFTFDAMRGIQVERRYASTIEIFLHRVKQTLRGLMSFLLGTPR